MFKLFLLGLIKIAFCTNNACKKNLSNVLSFLPGIDNSDAVKEQLNSIIENLLRRNGLGAFYDFNENVIARETITFEQNMSSIKEKLYSKDPLLDCTKEKVRNRIKLLNNSLEEIYVSADNNRFGLTNYEQVIFEAISGFLNEVFNIIKDSPSVHRVTFPDKSTYTNSLYFNTMIIQIQAFFLIHLIDQVRVKRLLQLLMAVVVTSVLFY